MRIARSLAVLALAGCAGGGTHADPAGVHLVRGVTTVARAKAVLGEPSVSSAGPDGAIVLIYSFAHLQAAAGNSDLVTRPPPGSDAIAFRFGPDGTYQSAVGSTANENRPAGF